MVALVLSSDARDAVVVTSTPLRLRLAVPLRMRPALVSLLAVGAGASGFVDTGNFDPETYWWEFMAPNATPVVERRERMLAAARASTSLEVTRGNATVLRGTASAERGRRLEEADCGLKIEGTVGYESPCCIRCQSLDKCKVLNGGVVEDKYYPSENLILGSCLNFEAQAGNLDIFGIERTFRDTPQCKELVYDYICSWWASSSLLYDNRCFTLTEYDADAYKILRPCRSFCTMVSVACANRASWGNLCDKIKCPPTGESCKPSGGTRGEADGMIERPDPLKACNRHVYITPKGVWTGIPSAARPSLLPRAWRTAIAFTIAAGALLYG